MNKLLKFWAGLSGAKIWVIIIVLAVNMPIQEVAAAWTVNDILSFAGQPENNPNLYLLTGRDSILEINVPTVPKTIRVVLTAYSSTPDQTDDTPFITASNTHVRDGVVAANFLAFGTKVQIPEIFGDKVFTVEDRMAKKHSDKIDIWFPERHLAKRFGVQEAEVIVME